MKFPSISAGNCTGEPDIVFVIDASGSITEEDESQWEVVKNLLSKTITQFATGNPNARSEYIYILVWKN